VLTLACLCALHGGLFVYQLGAPFPAEYWLYGCRIVKERLIRDLRSPKLLVAGGSNVLFGIDSAMLEDSLEIPTFNLALHGEMFLWQTLPDVQAHVAPGDHVLLAPGWAAYEPQPRYNAWLIDQVMTWDTEYFWQRDVLEKARFVGSVPVPRLLAGCMLQAFGRNLPEAVQRRLPPPAEIIEEYEQRPEGRTTERALVYSHLNLSARGDIVQTVAGRIEREDYGLGEAFRENDDTWSTLRTFREYCYARGVRVHLTWPPTVRSRRRPVFQAEAVRAHLREIRRHVEEVGITVLGEPQEFEYDRSLFADTPYHLNARGRALRTREIIRLLGERLPSRAAVP